MSFKEDLRAVVAEHMELDYGDWIVDVDVVWDNGLTVDPTYGDEHSSPTFEIRVRTAYKDKEGWIKLDTAFTLTALLKALLVERK